jgi:transposase
MPSIYIECPSCGEEGKIDETLVGRRIKCSKCGNSFKAEVGGSYDLAQPVRPPRQQSSADDAAEEQTTPQAPKKAKPKTDAQPADPQLDKLMEKWAEE